MKIIDKFSKYLKHVIHDVLDNDIDQDKFIEYYEHIYKACACDFNVETRWLYSIYLSLLENIKMNIEDKITEKVYEEINNNKSKLDIDDIDTINNVWYKYLSKCNSLNDIFIYLLDESKIYLEDYVTSNYKIIDIYKKLWNNKLFNNSGFTTCIIISDYITDIRLGLKQYKEIKIIELIKIFYQNRYSNLLTYIYKKGLEFYNTLYDKECIDLETLFTFYNKYIKNEKYIIDKYHFINGKHPDHRLLVYITDLCLFHKRKKLDKYILNYVCNLFDIKGEYIDSKIELFKNVLDTIISKYVLNEKENIINLIIEPLHKILCEFEKHNLINTIIRIGEVFTKLFSNNKFNYLYINFYKQKYRDKFNDNSLIKQINTQLNKDIQKDDNKALNLIPIIKLLDFEEFSIIYKKSLYKRILIGRTSYLFEKLVYCYMKQNQLYSNSLNIMVNDICKGSLSFKNNIVIGTKGVWPINTNISKTPKSFNNCKNEIEKKYKEEYPNRNLYWNNSSINAIIKFKEYEIQIGGIYVDFLNYFNENDSIKKTDICFKTYNKKKINNLVEIKLLIDNGKFYSINDNFVYNKKKINLL
jgi:hypothetical protein